MSDTLIENVERRAERAHRLLAEQQRRIQGLDSDEDAHRSRRLLNNLAYFLLNLEAHKEILRRAAAPATKVVSELPNI